jgi:hypothetical protein
MRIVRAELISRVVPGWPDQVIRDSVPLGREYRIDLDSKRVATLENRAHPEWGVMQVEAVREVDAGFPLPVCCLRIFYEETVH